MNRSPDVPVTVFNVEFSDKRELCEILGFTQNLSIKLIEGYGGYEQLVLKRLRIKPETAQKKLEELKERYLTYGKREQKKVDSLTLDVLITSFNKISNKEQDEIIANSIDKAYKLQEKQLSPELKAELSKQIKISCTGIVDL